MRDLKPSTGPSPLTRGMALRVRGVSAFFFLAFFGVFARAVYLQWHEADKLHEMAQDQYLHQLKMAAKRGDVFDRRGTALAHSVDVDSIWVDPSLLPDAQKAALALAKKLSLDAGELHARFLRSRRFAWVKRQAKPRE